MKNFHKMVIPPPSCICEILIQIFNRKFRDKIKMRQNSVNNHQSHPKFRCSTRLMLWTSYLSLSYTSKHPILAQNMPFWAFKFLNKSILRIFRNSENFPKTWKFFPNMKIFPKPENFPKFSNFFQKSQTFSKNLRIHKLQTLWNRNDFIDVPLACEDSWVWSQSGPWNGIFSCPEQLNRWPCHWLTHSLTEWVTFWFLSF